MNRVQSIGTAVLRFVVGEDWWVALAIILTIAIVFLSVRLGADWWWLLPLSVSTTVACSVVRATRIGSAGSSARNDDRRP